MKTMKVLAVVAFLVGLRAPVQAQGPLPVQVICFKGKVSQPDGTTIKAYQPICKQTKNAVKRSSDFKPAKSGNRYVVLLVAIKTADTPVVTSISYTAAISDPLSQSFPYHIISLPWVFETSDVEAMGEAVIDGGLPVAVDFFSDYVDEINSYGTFGKEISEEFEEEIAERVKREIDRTFEEKAKK
jgi:hypothetical protein